MAKTKSLKIRFEDEEYKKLEHHALVRGVPMSIIVRELIKAMPDKPAAVPIVKITYEVKQ
jgi:hypothetical protein